MASLKERFKSQLKKISKSFKEVGGAITGGAGGVGRAAKKKKLREGMMKATGQSPTQAAKISQRVDIAAQRKSGKRRPGQKMISAALGQREMKMYKKKK